MSRIARAACLILLLFITSISRAQNPSVTITGSNGIEQVNSGIEYIEDPGHSLSVDNVINRQDFKLLPGGTPNFSVTSKAVWLKIKIRNESPASRLILKLPNPGLDSVAYFEPMANGALRSIVTGESMPFTHREYQSTDYLFSVTLPQHSEKYVYLRISSSEALVVPLTVGTEPEILNQDKNKDIFWGMYIGLMLAMLFYNCFVYVTTKDNSYLFYIAYVLTVLLTQATLSGYTFQILWPDNHIIAVWSAFLTPVLVGIAGIQFMRHFLKTKAYVPTADKGFFVAIGLYCLAGILCLTGKYEIGFTGIDMVASSVSIYMLVIAGIISRRGYRPAVFFLISWIVFLIGVFVFVFKNFNILPYNNFTVYTMPVGSAMEVLLLSFALADRINILKKEKEQSQAQTMEALQENERIVREQNIMLEAKVAERTQELKIANDDLNKAMTELKEAETHLVESEKMASLGQLTAGIAHEINNPINFVSSNVKPLNRDVNILLDTISEFEKILTDEASIAERQKKIEEYKTEIDFDYLKIEIDQLLTGISDGASRTAEIVKGLRIFSRLDENDLKKADINEGLESTLVITNNLLGNTITVEKKYGNLPLVECYPGKLNQVFLNIISNAIYAIKKRYDDKPGGMLTISTRHDEDSVYISITDNGTGMDENTKKRLFEPFFTTKDVGEGTGLGLSISYNTIAKHNGQIKVNSELGIGTEFIIILPLIQK